MPVGVWRSRFQEQPNSRPEIDALKPRGAKTFMLKIGAGAEDLEQLRRFIWQSDAHVILTRLHPKELTAIQPILEGPEKLFDFLR